MKKQLLLLLPLFATVIGVLFALDDGSPRSRRAVRPEATAAPATTLREGPALPPLSLGFRAGEVCSYRFATARRTRIFRAGNAPALDRKVGLVGTLVVRIRRATADGWDVLFSVRDVRCGERALRGLEGEVRARLSRYGRISKRVYPDSMPKRAREILGTLQGQWQVALDGRHERRGKQEIVVRTRFGATRCVIDRIPRLIEGWRRRDRALSKPRCRVVHQIAFRFVRDDRAGGESGATAQPHDPRLRIRALVRHELAKLRTLVARDQVKGLVRHRTSVRFVVMLGRSAAAVDEVADRLRETSCSAVERAILMASLSAADTPACRLLMVREAADRRAG